MRSLWEKLMMFMLWRTLKLILIPCVVLGTTWQHVQLLKICAQQLMICNVCYFYFSPSVYCVHVRIVLLYWFIKHNGNKQVSGSNWMLSCVGWSFPLVQCKSSKLSRCFSRAQLSVGSPSSTPGCPSSPLDPSRSPWCPAPPERWDMFNYD